MVNVRGWGGGSISRVKRLVDVPVVVSYDIPVLLSKIISESATPLQNQELSAII